MRPDAASSDRCALVIGNRGQDGRLLTTRLQNEGAKVIGLGKGCLDGLVATAPVSLMDPDAIYGLIASLQPNEIYYLAAYHQSAEDAIPNMRELLHSSFDVHVHGLVNVLDAVSSACPKSRVFYAASSHVFGSPSAPIQDEQTSERPICAYGISKSAGMRCCQLYRQVHDVFVSVGILYNHESALRKGKFLSQKVIRAAIEIKQGKREKLVLGNLSTLIDWGYAADYVDAMVRILRCSQPDDFIVATGVGHSVGEFVEAVFGILGLDWREHVEERPDLLQKASRSPLIGDASKLTAATGWKPSMSFHNMIERLVADTAEGEMP